MDSLPGDSVEQQVKDKLSSAFLFPFGDEPPRAAPSIADPMQVQALQGAEMHAVRESLTLLAREIDSLKRAWPA